MADKFLLRCPECRESTAVQASQAGSTLNCSCGNRLEVPTIRQLRQLEPVIQAPDAVKSEWTARSGALFLGAFLAVVAAAPGVYLIATWPQPPSRDVPGSIARAEAAMAEMSIDRVWFYWYNEVELRGLAYNRAADEIAYAESTQNRRWLCYASFGAAVVGLAILLAAAVAKPATR